MHGYVFSVQQLYKKIRHYSGDPSTSSRDTKIQLDSSDGGGEDFQQVALGSNPASSKIKLQLEVQHIEYCL